MTSKEELLVSFDQVWSHSEESVELAVKNMTEEEAWYQHPAYSELEREYMHPPSGSVLWHLVHLGHCYQWYIDIIRARPDKPDEPLPPEASTFSDGIANVKTRRDKLRECIASLSDTEFNDTLYNGRTILDQVRMIIRHDAWHGGQIAVARRLYKYRATASGNT